MKDMNTLFNAHLPMQVHFCEGPIEADVHVHVH